MDSQFNVADIFKAGFEDCKNNPVLLAPILIVMAVMLVLALIVGGGALMGMGVMGARGDISAGAMAGVVGMGIFVMFMALVMFILQSLAFGMTVGMAQEAVSSGTTSLQTGMDIVKTYLGAFLIAAVLLGIILGVGFMLLVIPGFVAAFFLMFTFPAIVVDRVGGVEALGRSFNVVKGQIGNAVMVFLGLVAVMAIVFVVNIALAFVPIVGQLLSMAVGAAAGAYMAVVLTRTYQVLCQAG